MSQASGPLELDVLQLITYTLIPWAARSAQVVFGGADSELDTNSEYGQAAIETAKTAKAAIRRMTAILQQSRAEDAYGAAMEKAEEEAAAKASEDNTLGASTVLSDVEPQHIIRQPLPEPHSAGDGFRSCACSQLMLGPSGKASGPDFTSQARRHTEAGKALQLGCIRPCQKCPTLCNAAVEQCRIRPILARCSCTKVFEGPFEFAVTLTQLLKRLRSQMYTKDTPVQTATTQPSLMDAGTPVPCSHLRCH